MDARGGSLRPARTWGVVGLFACIAVVTDLVVFYSLLTSGSTECNSNAQCDARGWVLPVAFLGGWVAVVVAAVLRGSRGLAVAGVLCLVSVLALPGYATFRDGWSGVSVESRERRHDQVRDRVKEVVDGTLGATAAGREVEVTLPSGEREANSSDTCEREIYQVTFAFTRTERDALADRVAAHWRDTGLSVDAAESREAVRASSGEVQFGLFMTEPRYGAKMYGAGPCLKK